MVKQISLSDQNYPYLLKQIPDPPQKLFLRGQYQQFDWKKWRFLAIIGSRRPSEYGRRIAREWAFRLAQEKIVLVSGLALGIDTIVHQEALKAKAPTIAVLGCAIDYIYPKENYQLYWQIVNNGGLIMSEFGPKTFVPKPLFITRNRLISGLCHTILLIEGTNHSGTLITSRYGLEQGREILVLPGQVDNPASAAPLMLLKQGAMPVSSFEEVLEAV